MKHINLFDKSTVHYKIDYCVSDSVNFVWRLCYCVPLFRTESTESRETAESQNSKKEAVGNCYINLRHLLKRVTPEPGRQPGLQPGAQTIPRPQQTICRGA